MNNGDSNLSNELSNDTTVDNTVVEQPADNAINNLGDPVYNFIPNDVIDDSSVISVDDIVEGSTIDIDSDSTGVIPVADIPTDAQAPAEESTPDTETVSVEDSNPAVENSDAEDNSVVDETPAAGENVPVENEMPTVEAEPVQTDVVEMPSEVSSEETPVEPQVVENPIAADEPTGEEVPVSPIPVVENPVVEPEPVVEPVIAVDTPAENPTMDNDVPAEFESMIAQTPIDTNNVPTIEPVPVAVNPAVDAVEENNPTVGSVPVDETNSIPAENNIMDAVIENSEPNVQNQVFNTDIPQGMPQFGDGKKTKKRKKTKNSTNSNEEKAKMKNTIEAAILFVGVIVFAILFFKDTLFPKEEKKPVETIINVKNKFVGLMGSAFSYSKVNEVRGKVLDTYKSGTGNLKVSSEAIGMKELNVDFNISIDNKERKKDQLPWIYFIGNGTYDNEKLFYSDLMFYYKNNSVFFWIPKTAENDKIDENKDKFFIPKTLMLDNHLKDKYVDNYANLLQMSIEYINANFNDSYFSTRKDGDMDVYQLNLDGTAIRDLAYILLPKLQVDSRFNVALSSVLDFQIDYIYLMGDPEEYDENDPDNEVYETVEELAPNYSLIIDLYTAGSTVNKAYIEYKDGEKTHYLTMILDGNNYDITYSYKNNNSENIVQVFHIDYKNIGDEYTLSLDYGKTLQMDLDAVFSLDDKNKLPNLVAIRNYRNQDELLRREVQYRFEKSPGITKFKKDTGMNLDFIFQEQQ